VSNQVEIYTLICPISKKVMYVGKANDSNKRLKSHIRDSVKRKTPVYLWIRELIKRGLMPIVEVVEVTDELNWMQKEKQHIAKFRKTGLLLNVSAGGKEPHCPKEVRAENGRKVAKLIHENPLRKKIWAAKRAIMETLFTLKKKGDIEGYNTIAVKCNLLADKKPNLFSNLRTELL